MWTPNFQRHPKACLFNQIYGVMKIVVRIPNTAQVQQVGFTLSAQESPAVIYFQRALVTSSETESARSAPSRWWCPSYHFLIVTDIIHDGAIHYRPSSVNDPE